MQACDIAGAKSEYQQGLDLLLRRQVSDPSGVADSNEFKLLLIALLGNTAAAMLKTESPDYYLVIQHSNEVTTQYRYRCGCIQN